MRIPCCSRSPVPVAVIVALATVPAGCATLQQHGARDRSDCEFVVYNRTPHPVEVRLGIGLSSSSPIGALNPGELLPYSVACSERRVWVLGVAIPPQVGGPVFFDYVQGWGDVFEGERVDIALYWP
jgi:hypothetical protein